MGLSFLRYDINLQILFLTGFLGLFKKLYDTLILL